jgi:hypothetical protein
MTRHSLAEILLMVLAVCGALAIVSLVGIWLVHPSSYGIPPGTSGVTFSVRRVSAVSFSTVIVAVVVIAFALAVSLRSGRD